MSFQIPRIRTCVLLVFAAAAIACNQAALGRVPVYPARGKALYKGSPLPGALVVFEPIGATADGTGSANIAGQLRATGRTGPDGSFQLRTYQGDEWLFFLCTLLHGAELVGPSQQGRNLPAYKVQLELT